MVTTGPAPTRNTHPTAPLDLAYWVQFRRGDYRGGPAYTGTYGFDWVEWKRNSANNPHTAYDDLTHVTGTHIRDYVQCYDPGIPDTPAQPATATTPAIPAKPGIPPHYAAVSGLYKQRYEDELHKGYPKRIVQGNDYYVPWLSVQPHQTVQLKLEVEFLNKNPVQPTNLFTVAPHPDYLVTINGKPNTAPMQLVPVDKQVLDVTIESLRPSAATSLRVEDEHNNLVGELQIADNTTVYELPLRVVYVLRGIPMNPKDPLDATPRRPLYAPTGALATLQNQFQALRSQGVDLPTFLNQHSLNQALIRCTFQTPTTPYQLLMDLDQWKKDRQYSPSTNQLSDSKGLAKYCTDLANSVHGPAFAAFRGVTIYVFELDVAPDPGQGATNASGSNVPVVASTLRLFQSGLTGPGQGKASTVAHELGHVLGLTHAFPMPSGYEDGEIKQLLSQKIGPTIVLPGQIALLAQAKAAAATPPTPVEQADIQAKQDSVKITTDQLTEINAQLAMYANNPFKFTKQSTHNMMDYDAADNRCFYWHWQWFLLQADVAAYYGTTTAAH